MKANIFAFVFILIHSVSGRSGKNSTVNSEKHISGRSHDEHPFSYTEQHKWGGLCTTGTRQSPINLWTESSTHHNVERMFFLRYEEKHTFSAVNNGHTIKLILDSPCKYAIVGGGLPDVYDLDHIHFHWASEHLFAGNRMAAEAHFVHYRRHHGNVEKAAHHHYGLAVLSVLFEESGHENKVLKELLPYFSNSSAPQVSKYQLAPLKLLPKFQANFFRYSGSLTTPPCSETVIWTVFRSMAHISKAQKKQLDSISLNGLFYNFRHIQLFNSRTLYVMDFDEERSMFMNGAKPSQAEKAFCFLLTLAGFYPTLRIYVT